MVQLNIIQEGKYLDLEIIDIGERESLSFFMDKNVWTHVTWIKFPNPLIYDGSEILRFDKNTVHILDEILRGLTQELEKTAWWFNHWCKSLHQVIELRKKGEYLYLSDPEGDLINTYMELGLIKPLQK